MKLASLVTAAGLALVASVGIAQASPYSGTFTIDVFQGTGNGTSTAAIEQANNVNPLLATTALAAFTYTGAINFTDGGSNNIATFLASAGGTLSNFTTGSAAALNTMLSTGGFALTTFFEIFGTTGSSISGTVQHDDGASLYQGATTVFDSSPPTVSVPSAYTLSAGAFTLDYVEANGLPADLTMNVPEPASLALLGLGLVGLGAIRRRRGGSKTA